MEKFLTGLSIIAGVVLLIVIINIPGFIARKRNVDRNNLMLIIILQWCGLLAGVTWLIALILALTHHSENNAEVDSKNRL